MRGSTGRLFSPAWALSVAGIGLLAPSAAPAGAAAAASLTRNGSRKWRVVYSPPMAGHVNLVGLTRVPGTKNLWAGGGSGSSTLAERFQEGSSGTTFQTLVERWSGRNWKVVASPNASAHQNFLRGGGSSGKTATPEVGYRLPRESIAAATWRGEAIIVRCRPGT